MKVTAALAGAACVTMALTAACFSSSSGGDSHPEPDGGGGGSGGGSGSSSGSSSGSGSGGGSGSSSGSGSGGANVVTFASGQQNPFGVVSNGSYVAWTTCNGCLSNLNGQGSIMAAPATGGTPVALATSTDNGGFLAIDATDVYWFGPDNGSIVKAPLTGAASATNVLSSLTNDPLEIGVDGTFIYWSNGASIHDVPLDGGTNKSLATSSSLIDQYQTQCFAVSAAGIFATTADSILMFPLAGGAATTLASGQSPLAITADATAVYWTNQGGASTGALMKVDVSAGATPVMLAPVPTLAVPEAIAVDASNVYWIEALGSVKKVALGGGTPVVLAPAPNSPGGIAVDGTSVYWTDTAGGTVLKTAK